MSLQRKSLAKIDFKALKIFLRYMNRKVLQNDYSAFLALLFYFKSLVNFITVKLTKLEMNIFHILFYTGTSFP